MVEPDEACAGGVDRHRVAGCLRALSGLALVVLALALFWQPLRAVLAPKVVPVMQKVPLPEVLRPSPKGFMVRVVSEPRGATVWIDGDERGRAPLFANVACEEGQEVVIEVAASGHPPWRRTVPCRVGGELTVRARLEG